MTDISMYPTKEQVKLVLFNKNLNKKFQESKSFDIFFKYLNNRLVLSKDAVEKLKDKFNQ